MNVEGRAKQDARAEVRRFGQTKSAQSTRKQSGVNARIAH
jgi:hypothetical protein